MNPLWIADRWFCPDCHALLTKAPWMQYGERFHRFGCEHALIASHVIVLPTEAAPAVIPRAMAAALLERVRHDHGYPVDIGPHHCPGCELEERLRGVLDGVDAR